VGCSPFHLHHLVSAAAAAVSLAGQPQKLAPTHSLVLLVQGGSCLMCQQTADQHHLLVLLLQPKDHLRLFLLLLLLLLGPGKQVGLVAVVQLAVLVGPTGHVQRGAGQATYEAMGH
jgi:hypothetical protein